MAIIATPVPASYRDYCSLLQMVSHNLENLQNRKQFRPIKPTQARSVDDTMEWEPTTVAATGARATRAKWVSQEEMKQRRESSACLRCGRQGHLIANCPLLPATRPASEKTQVASATNKPAQGTVEDSSEDDSGKE